MCTVVGFVLIGILSGMEIATNGNHLNGHANGTNGNDVANSTNGTNGSQKSYLKYRDPVVCEVSPLVSYAGEGLEELVTGKKLTPPVLLVSKEEENGKGDRKDILHKNGVGANCQDP